MALELHLGPCIQTNTRHPSFVHGNSRKSSGIFAYRFYKRNPIIGKEKKLFESFFFFFIGLYDYSIIDEP